VLTAIPFLLAGQPLAAIAAIAPDIPWIPQEWAYRKACKRAARRHVPWHRWVRTPAAVHPAWLRAYRLTHSPIIALATSVLLSLVLPIVTAQWIAVAWLTHIVLDLFTHDGVLRMRPLYPFSEWRWPFVARRYAMNRERGRTELVLLSGGWESAACLVLALDDAARTGARVLAVHVQYGQEYAQQEVLASMRLAHAFEVLRIERRLPDLPCTDGVFERRNERLLLEARAVVHPSIIEHRVWFGGRAPLMMFDRHRDSNAQWVIEMARKHDMDICVPLLLHPKWLVKARARSRGVTDAMVFSSEGWKYKS
jgi:hypothetical protein